MCKLVILLVAALVIAVTHAHPHSHPPCPSMHVLRDCTCTGPHNGYPNIVCDGHDMSSSQAFSVMEALPRDVTYSSIELHGFDDMEEVPEHVFDGLHFEHGSLKIDDSHHHGAAPVLHAHSFEDMDHLEELTLSYLKLTYVPAIIFPFIKDSVERLSLKGNDITELIPDAFDELCSTLVELNLAENNLEFIHPMALRGLHNLNVLDLSSAAVLYLLPGTFIEVENLETLELAGNGLVSLQQGVFAGLHHVEHLDFTGSSLTWIAPGAFDDTESILTVDMPNQHLYYIAEDAFRGLTDIEEIDLSGNHLTTLASNVFDDDLFDYHHYHHHHHHHHDHDDHVHIDLTDNPLICGCDIAWLTVDPFYTEGTCTNGNNFAISLSHLHLACP
ncbi:PREDICTED: insulin-like growth factor-binding protein complex acid labile subunit [Priapulus caudatus]|uniref:Insulin-like growth factor-binding protein complex acid labile subunit n=1 Tax=Priapulus caudatus TaxID=37621 RepID=A0ABM1F1W8_PRICU|nr:PREDICTED: insulin-like growth factor-binding protein complex acid labile subunit [Priapulus caudatus]